MREMVDADCFTSQFPWTPARYSREHSSDAHSLCLHRHHSQHSERHNRTEAATLRGDTVIGLEATSSLWHTLWKEDGREVATTENDADTSYAYRQSGNNELPTVANVGRDQDEHKHFDQSYYECHNVFAP